MVRTWLNWRRQSGNDSDFVGVTVAQYKEGSGASAFERQMSWDVVAAVFRTLLFLF
jgi:hypothetical protein